MSEESEDRADALFHALADRTRRDILRRVLAGEHSVSAPAAKYDMGFAAVQDVFIAGELMATSPTVAGSAPGCAFIDTRPHGIQASSA